MDPLGMGEGEATDKESISVGKAHSRMFSLQNQYPVTHLELSAVCLIMSK